MTITFPMAHHYCITDTAAHGQEIFKTMIQFPNHEHEFYYTSVSEKKSKAPRFASLFFQKRYLTMTPEKQLKNNAQSTMNKMCHCLSLNNVLLHHLQPANSCLRSM
ncbi:hypothetical protein SY86_18980 [Erwinia tracheiphila]|uniref:Uncharacterized protein n=1 Tax=Erwinia tracheiphila TaxID=65700 RepID=A0A0M2KDL9_9GAMM|nr:hypothetical protein SY86_18980 [Erwinia tracheiphila]